MRVLSVEDDRATADSIAMMLRSEAYVCDTAELGEDGLEIAKLYDYDIILLDLMLPDMDGLEVLRRLRMAKIQTPVVILTGLAEMMPRIKGFGHGADDYLVKPVDKRELLARSRQSRARGSHVGECAALELRGLVDSRDQVWYQVVTTHQLRFDVPLLLLGPFVAFFGTGYFSGFGAVTAEIYPTAIRATAQGFTYNIGRVASAAAPFAVGTLAQTSGFHGAFSLAAAAFLVAAMFWVFIPETRGRPLA